MKAILSQKVSIAWLLTVIALAPAGGIVYKLAILDAPPSGVLISLPAETSSFTASPAPKSQATSVPGVAIHVEPSATSSVTAIEPPTTTSQVTTTTAPTPILPATPTAELIAYISGEVAHAGVYHLPLDSRVADLVSAAGGLTIDADGDLINLAERLQDEEHVVVPAKGRASAVALIQTPLRTPTRAVPTATRLTARPSPTSVTLAPAAKININSATQQELETLTGIGPSLAARIIEYRQANGPFSSPEDLMKVPGIKQGIYSKLKDSITVSP